METDLMDVQVTLKVTGQSDSQLEWTLKKVPLAVVAEIEKILIKGLSDFVNSHAQ